MSVKIIKSKNNNVFEPTKRPGLLCLAVEEIQDAKAATLEGKFSQQQGRRIAFIFRTQAEFDTIFAAMKVTPAENTELPGIVVVKEQVTPFSDTNPTVNIKYPNAAAKAAGLACTFEGKPIYRDTLYTTDEDMQDTLQPHDNGAAIQEFVRKMNATAPAKANTPALTASSPATNSRRRSATTS